MEKRNKPSRAVDILLLVLAVLPLLFAMLLKILTTPASEDISITGARVYCEIKGSFVDFYLTESQINSWMIILSLFWMCLYMTRGLSEKAETKRQLICEWIVEKCEGMIHSNMGEYFKGFGPFIAAIMGLSCLSSICTLIGLFPPTSDMNVVAGWAILVFILITYYKMKCGPLHYLKSFTEPTPVLTPLNLISEVATPVSMAFRHYGNILSGSVISVLMAALLQNLSAMIFGWLPGFLGNFPFLQVGLPAVMSIYFDIFSGGLQAFIFAMLTMLYVAGAFPEDDYMARKARKAQRKKENT